MGSKNRVIDDLALIVGFIGTAIATGVSIRANVQIAVVLCVLILLVIFFIWGFRLHTHRSGGILPSPDSTKFRRYGGYLLLVPLIAAAILLAVPGTSNYIYTAFAGTPTPTIAAPSPTPPVAGASISQPAQQATPSSTPIACFCQKSTDDLTIQCLINAESQAANNGSLDVITHIFSPEATVFRGNDPQRPGNRQPNITNNPLASSTSVLPSTLMLRRSRRMARSSIMSAAVRGITRKAQKAR